MDVKQGKLRNVNEGRRKNGRRNERKERKMMDGWKQGKNQEWIEK